MTELLTQQLTPGEEADGQEYQRTLDDQGEAETYLMNYASLLADRREALLRERTLLAAHDAVWLLCQIKI
jgi:E3 ubiquitin-protein ligase SHPRH